MIVTRTGWIFRASVSGSVIEMVKMEPKLVPIHNVGVNVDGSMTKKKEEQSGVNMPQCDDRRSVESKYLPLFFV